MKITAVVLTKNEEKNIKECLLTLGFLDEILIVDDNSTDNTIAIVNDLRDKKIKIFSRNLSNNFSEQRNFALEKAKNEFVLFVDADERVTPQLREELTLIDDNFDGLLIKRTDVMWGRRLKYGETGNIYLLRLGNKNKGNWSGTVHETWDIKGKTRNLRGEIEHFPHQSISEFLREINYYTDLRAKELFDSGVKSGFLSIILYAKGKFILDYIIKRGFKDGMPGIILSLIMSFHSFLVRGKLWYLWQKK